MTRVDIMREAHEVIAETKRRSIAALLVKSMSPVAKDSTGVQFVISFDVSGVKAEIDRGRRALDELRARLSRPRVVRGDRVGRRRSRRRS